MSSLSRARVRASRRLIIILIKIIYYSTSTATANARARERGLGGVLKLRGWGFLGVLVGFLTVVKLQGVRGIDGGGLKIKICKCLYKINNGGNSVKTW